MNEQMLIPVTNRSSFLINPPLQRGIERLGSVGNRFNGFPGVGETVETVSRLHRTLPPPLKRGGHEQSPRRSDRRRETCPPKAST